jgi:hypothetical protein
MPGPLVRMLSATALRVTQLWCGLHGHVVMLHFEPHKLSLQCSQCGYESKGWEVGYPMTSRRQLNNPQVRPERRGSLRRLPSKARLAS